MRSPADICEQWERNLSIGSADVSGAGTRDETPEKVLIACCAVNTTNIEMKPFLSCHLKKCKNRQWKIAKSSSKKDGRGR